MPLPTTPTLSRAGLSSKNQNTLASMLHARAFPDSGASDFSETASVQTLADTLAPKPVTGLSATAVASGIRLDMTLPTQNADDTTLTDLKWLVIYYHSSSGIDVDNAGTYTDTETVAAATQWTDRGVTAGSTRYYKVVARDDAGNDSVASSEVNAEAGLSASVSIPADATSLVFDGDPKVGDAMLGLIFDDPATTWAGFIHWEIQYAVSADSGSSWGGWTALTKTDDPGYVHKGLTTTAGYRYKYRGRPVGRDGTASTTWDESDNSGNGWPNGGTWQSDNANIVGETVIAEKVVATDEVRTAHIKAGAVTATEIAALTITASEINTNAITTAKINGLAVTHGKASENSIRTYEIQVDGGLDINSPTGYVINLSDAYAGSSGATQRLYLNDGSSGTKLVGGHANCNSFLGPSNSSFEGNVNATLRAHSGDTEIRAGDDILLDVGDADHPMYITDWVETDSDTFIGHEGWIKVIINGATRYILLYD